MHIVDKWVYNQGMSEPGTGDVQPPKQLGFVGKITGGRSHVVIPRGSSHRGGRGGPQAPAGMVVELEGRKGPRDTRVPRFGIGREEPIGAKIESVPASHSAAVVEVVDVAAELGKLQHFPHFASQDPVGPDTVDVPETEIELIKILRRKAGQREVAEAVGGSELYGGPKGSRRFVLAKGFIREYRS